MKTKAILLLAIFTTCSVYSQLGIGRLATGDKKYDKYAYIDAIEIYEMHQQKAG